MADRRGAHTGGKSGFLSGGSCLKPLDPAGASTALASRGGAHVAIGRPRFFLNRDLSGVRRRAPTASHRGGLAGGISAKALRAKALRDRGPRGSGRGRLNLVNCDPSRRGGRLFVIVEAARTGITLMSQRAGSRSGLSLLRPSVLGKPPAVASVGDGNTRARGLRRWAICVRQTPSSP